MQQNLLTNTTKFEEEQEEEQESRSFSNNLVYSIKSINKGCYGSKKPEITKWWAWERLHVGIA